MIRPNRRRFCVGAAAAWAMAATSAAARTDRKYDVIVIGAGLAGLNAALLLSDEGYSVKVLEGKNKVGGRVETAHGVETRPELGASQIGRDYARVLATCQRFGLALIPEDRDLLEFSSHLQGQWIGSSAWADSPLNPLTGDDRTIPPVMLGSRLMGRHNPLVQLSDWFSPEYAHLDIPAYELFRQQGYSEAAIQLAGLSVYGNDLYSTSCLTMMQEQHRGRWAIDRFSGMSQVVARPYGYGEEGFDGSSPLALISNLRDGTDALPKAMAAQLGEDAISLNKIAMRIEMTGADCTVQTLDGDSFRSDFVISAIPFTTLRRIDIRPGLPMLQARAVEQLPYSNTSRAHLLIKEPFWLEDGIEPSFFSDGAIKMFWSVDNHSGQGAHVGYMVMTGDSAGRVDMMPPDDARKFLQEELVRVRPAARDKVEIVAYKSWENDPFIRGVRHGFAPGQVTEFAGTMARPHMRLHFAGEHTRQLEIGMEAAMESGERAALEIIEATT